MDNIGLTSDDAHKSTIYPDADAMPHPHSPYHREFILNLAG